MDITEKQYYKILARMVLHILCTETRTMPTTSALDLLVSAKKYFRYQSKDLRGKSLITELRTLVW